MQLNFVNTFNKCQYRLYDQNDNCLYSSQFIGKIHTYLPLETATNNRVSKKSSLMVYNSYSKLPCLQMCVCIVQMELRRPSPDTTWL